MFKHHWNPTGRFGLHTVDWEVPPLPRRLRVVVDSSRTALVHNNSADLGFDWSVNPYRGCTHACAYCYARANHEYLDLGAGSDFERVISIKPEIAALLRAEIHRSSWRGEHVAFSGVTDCYQPLERRYGLTRACLEVCAAYRNPVAVTTRSPLILRDLDLLGELGRHDAVRVTLSIPLADPEVARALEPGAPPPAARLRAVAALAEAGIPVGVSLMPVIPGLNDHAIPSTLTQAREAGARWAWIGLVRLPGTVREVFETKLREALPDRAPAVLARLARAEVGRSSAFGERSKGTGQGWALTEALFQVWVERLGFAPMPRFPSPSPFRRPGHGEQLSLLERT